MINFIKQHSSLKAPVCNEIFRQSLPREAIRLLRALQNNYQMTKYDIPTFLDD